MCVFVFYLDYSATDPILLQAIAQSRARLEGVTLGVRNITKDVFNNLIYYGQIDSFYKLLLATKDAKGDINTITASQFQNYANGIIPAKQWCLVTEAFDLISDKLINIIIEISSKSASDAVIMSESDFNLIQALNIKLKQIKLIKDNVDSVRDLHTDKSILNQLTYAFKNGWNCNNLWQLWLQGNKLEFDIAKLSSKMDLDSSGSKKNKKFDSNTASTNPSLKSKSKSKSKSKPKVSVFDRTQRPTQIGTFFRNDVEYIAGTQIEAKKGVCNNQQVWNWCEIVDCGLKHVCSLCFQTNHGAVSCPKRH